MKCLLPFCEKFYNVFFGAGEHGTYESSIRDDITDVTWGFGDVETRWHWYRLSAISQAS